MAQYAKVVVRLRSKKAPDFGIGKGVLAYKLVKLDDDEHSAAAQMIYISQDLMEETVETKFIPATEEEWNKEKE